jgi:hypothetical protein
VHIGFVAQQGHTAEGSHPNPEKFIEIVGEYTQELDTFTQRHGVVGCFLQYAVVKGKPADIAGNRLLFWHNAPLIYWHLHKTNVKFYSLS